MDSEFGSFEDYFRRSACGKCSCTQKCETCENNDHKEFLFRDYDNIKRKVTRIAGADSYWIYQEIINGHPERIIGLIFEFIKQKDPITKKSILDRLKLSPEEQYILLYAAYLHDLAKAFPCLRIDNITGPLNLDQIKKIESYHAFDIFRILMFHIFIQHSSALKNGFNLQTMLDLWKFFEFLPTKEQKHQNDREKLIKSIALICGMHKSLTLEAEQKMKDRMEKFLRNDPYREEEDKVGENPEVSWSNDFTEINVENLRIDLLAALLKLGDCFDISVKRINEQKLANVEAGFSTIENAQVLTKWYQFAFVKEEVKPEINGNELRIVVKYSIPRYLENKSFAFFRKLAEEKDFRDLTYLKIIEYYLNNKDIRQFNIARFREYISKKYKNDQELKNTLTITAKYRVKKNGKDVLPSIMEYVDKLLEKSSREVKRPLIEVKFFPGNDASPSRQYPTSKEVLYILALFYRFPTESFELSQIKEKTGIKIDKIDVICKKLETEGYLKQEKDEYKKAPNKDKDKIIEEIMEEYRRNPYGLKIKGEEIELFGEFMPLENITKGDIIQTGIPGLDNVLSQRGENGGITSDSCILVKGSPGTGKTTLGMQTLIYNDELNCLYLSFEEDIKQLEKDFKDFEWDLNTLKIRSLAFLRKEKGPAEIFERLVKIIDEVNPDLIVIDSISRFREFSKESASRKILTDFISILKIRHITAIFIGEEVKNGYEFEEYLVDGLIEIQSDESGRYLMIRKTRGQGNVEGKHSYKIYDKKSMPKDLDFKPGINVFPNMKTYLGLLKQEKSPERPISISSGTKGLDDILPVDKGLGGFIPGESITVVGCPGTGKTLIGLQFLKAGAGRDNRRLKEKSLWISFEGNQEQLEKSIANFEK
ncbi:hypothetical protein D4S03_02915, partial [bacterium]